MRRVSLARSVRPPVHALAVEACVAPSFRAVFEGEFAYVFNSLCRLGVRRCDLEDVTHEVFVAVHRALPDYDPTRPLRPWLFGIAFRLASDYRRSARFAREVPREPSCDVADAAPPADEQIAAEQARRVLLEALEALHIDRRAVVVMHDVDGCPIPEIAHALSIPVNTAYSRLRLGREDLRAAVKRIRLRRGDL
jgi:RNA polymerase sigma-70 factor (ECF subfamily)